MRDYVPKECMLPRWIYQTVLSTVRGYDDMILRVKETELDVIYEGMGSQYSETKNEGQKGQSHPTEDKAIRMMKLKAYDEFRINAINNALILIQPDIRKIILSNIKHGTPLRYDFELERNRTIGRYKYEFIRRVAQNMNLI